MKILIVDDEEMIRAALREYVEFEGGTADEAQDGMEAVRMCREYDYDVILMDLRMPVMTGYEAARAIRDLDRADADTIPIIAMSADAYRDDVQKCLDCGMKAHVPKPIDMQEVIRLLEKYLLP